MAIGRISGQLLYSNLERQGQDLTFDGNLLHLDVNNRRIGIKTNSPQYELDVVGTVRANEYIGVTFSATGNVSVGNLTASGDLVAGDASVSSLASTGPISGTTGTFGNVYTNLFASFGSATVDSLAVNTTATVGGNLTVSGNTELTGSASIGGAVVGDSTASFAGGINNTSIGAITPSTGSFTNLTATGASTITSLDASGAVIITDTTVSVDYTTGALVVAGGTGIGGNLNVAGNTAIIGAIDVTGNAYIDGALLVGELITNTSVSVSGNITATGDASITGNISGATGTFTDNVYAAGNTTISSTQITMNATTPSSDYTSGALVVAGGVGVAGNLNVQGAISTSNLIVNGGDLTNVNIGNITFSNTTVTTKLVNGNITLTPTGTGLIYMDTTLAVKLPTGNTSQQPSNPPIGAIRYNTEFESPEFWNGINWIPTTTTIDSEVINPDGVNNIFALSRVTTSTGVFVSINGVIQVPGTAYAISGNQITFTEVPLVTDIVDVRYMTTGSVVPLHEEQSFLVRTVGFNAAPNTRYAVDTSATPITVMLPAIPFTGDAIFFADAGGAYSTNNLTIDPNGETIMGSPASLVITTDGESFGLLWNGTTWKRY